MYMAVSLQRKMSRYFNVDQTLDDKIVKEHADEATKIFTTDTARFNLHDDHIEKKSESKKKKKRKRDRENEKTAESIDQVETHDLSSANLTHSTIIKHKTKPKHSKDEHGQKKIRGKVVIMIL